MGELLVVAPPGPEADALCGALEADGLEVLRAGSGAEGVSLAAAHRPRAVLLDPGLAAIDRWHAAKRLAADAATAGIPVITLAERPSERSPARIVAAIERTTGLVPRRSRPEDDTGPALVDVSPGVPLWTGPAAAPDPRLARVLLVAGNRTLREAWARRLERRGYEVEVAGTAAGALAAVDGAPSDLVVLDLALPDLPGLEVLRRIRAQHTPVALPVLVTAAPSGPDPDVDGQISALAAGANDFLARPLDLDVLTARIRAHLAVSASHRDLALRAQQHAAMVEATGDLILLLDPDGTVLFASPACREVLGLEVAELVGRSLGEQMHPLDRRTLEERQSGTQRLVPAAGVFVARLRARDGRYVWFETSCRSLRQVGRPVVVAACRDVSEHMERLAGDEPPLPLGGDIAAHPYWRADVRAPSVHPAVSVVVVGDPAGVAVDDLARQLSRELRRALDPAAAGSLTDEGGSA